MGTRLSKNAYSTLVDLNSNIAILLLEMGTNFDCINALLFDQSVKDMVNCAQKLYESIKPQIDFCVIGRK